MSNELSMSRPVGGSNERSNFASQTLARQVYDLYRISAEAELLTERFEPVTVPFPEKIAGRPVPLGDCPFASRTHFKVSRQGSGHVIVASHCPGIRLICSDWGRVEILHKNPSCKMFILKFEGLFFGAIERLMHLCDLKATVLLIESIRNTPGFEAAMDAEHQKNWIPSSYDALSPRDCQRLCEFAARFKREHGETP